jgi:hypothetical protein
MPRVSLVGNGHGGNEDYATLALWWAAESGVDYGSQIEAYCLGNCGTDIVLSGTTVYGYLIDSPVKYVGNNHLDLPLFSFLTVFALNGVIRNFRAINISSNGAALTHSASETIIEKYYVSMMVGSTNYCVDMYASNTNKVCKNFVIDGTNTSYALGLVRYGYNRSYNCYNYIMFGGVEGARGSAGVQGFTDGFSFNFSGSDYGSGLELTNAASEDATGSAGLTGYTSAELVDPNNGDLRTKATSFLATAGTGGSFVGAFLEVSAISTDQAITVITAEQLTESQLVTVSSLNNINAVIAEQSTQVQLSDVILDNQVSIIVTEQITQSSTTGVNESQLIYAVQSQQLSDAMSVVVTTKGPQDINAVVAEQITHAINADIQQLLATNAVIAEQLTQTELLAIIQSNIANELNIDIDQITLEILTPRYSIESLTPIYTIEHIH